MGRSVCFKYETLGSKSLSCAGSDRTRVSGDECRATCSQISVHGNALVKANRFNFGQQRQTCELSLPGTKSWIPRKFLEVYKMFKPYGKKFANLGAELEVLIVEAIVRRAQGHRCDAAYPEVAWPARSSRHAIRSRATHNASEGNDWRGAMFSGRLEGKRRVIW
jgi:hypothetical protein